MYAFDKRIPTQALATYLYVANVQRKTHAPSWRHTLDMAGDVAEYLDDKGPTNWERFFLAEYLYEQAESDDQYKLAWSMLRELSDEGHDVATNFYLALTYELGEEPSTDVMRRATTNADTVYGLHGAGCWYALNDESEIAIDYANGHRIATRLDSQQKQNRVLNVRCVRRQSFFPTANGGILVAACRSILRAGKQADGH